ncbi:hypothetical protein ACP6PL_20050 [Dapis sp. BLCC M126]|uniref:hypothetical protein n=1 Tax=Dapis sp. BLCC M126 TaxID=3400189 RepID=UPI003CF4C4B2
MTILLFKKVGLIALIPVCLTVFFEYPSFSKNYTQNQKISANNNYIFKLNKPQSVKYKNQYPTTYIRNGMEVSEDGCIIKNLTLRNGMNLKIKQNCN